MQANPLPPISQRFECTMFEELYVQKNGSIALKIPIVKFD